MKKGVFLTAAFAAMLAVSCQQQPKDIDWSKGTMTITPSGDTTVYKYDQNGNMIFDGVTNCNYKYNDKNQLVEIEQNGDVIKMEYDERGNLVAEVGGYEMRYTYNDKNQKVSSSYSESGQVQETTTYEYEGNKVTVTMIQSSDEDYADTTIIVSYYMDPEYQYDTLVYEECKSQLFPYYCKEIKKWQMVCGEYKKIMEEVYDKKDDEYVFYNSHIWEYNENGYVQKQILKDNTKGETIEINYTREGNKLTGSDGSVYYFLEK